MSPWTNAGNFLAFLKDFAEEDHDFKQHLDNEGKKNTTYVSLHNQSEIINIISDDIILHELKDEVKFVPFYSVLAHEVSNHNQSTVYSAYRL